MAAADPMAPGTPVYVEVPVNISKVRRSMPKANCKVVFVLQEDLVVGLIDLSEPWGTRYFILGQFRGIVGRWRGPHDRRSHSPD